VVKYTFQDIPVSSEPGYKNDCNRVQYGKRMQPGPGEKTVFDIPIVEVVGPGAATAVRGTVNKKSRSDRYRGDGEQRGLRKSHFKAGPGNWKSIRRLVLCLCHWLRKAGGKMTLR